MITGMASAAPTTSATDRYVKKPSPGRIVTKLTPACLPWSVRPSTAIQVIELLRPGTGTMATSTPTTTAMTLATRRPRSSSRCSRRLISLSPGAWLSVTTGLVAGVGGVWVTAMGTCAAWVAAGSLYAIAAQNRRECRSLRPAVLVQVVHRVLDRADLLGVLVADLHVELFFERHDQLDQVERVGVQVVDEVGLGRHLVFADAQLLGDDFLQALFSARGHRLFSSPFLSSPGYVAGWLSWAPEAGPPPLK